MDVGSLIEIITNENRRLLAQIKAPSVFRFMESLDRAKRIFCGAQGRSGNVLRCFCMRLMHLGFESYCAGETTTPRLAEKDLLVVLSGSGDTPWTVEIAKRARELGVDTFGIIGREDSSLGKHLDDFLVIPGGAKAKGSEGASWSVQPAGSLFEQSAFLLLEAVVLALFEMQGSDRQALLSRHTNLE
jgi:6-phospho-3-hexuloisomerase